MGKIHNHNSTWPAGVLLDALYEHFNKTDFKFTADIIENGHADLECRLKKNDLSYEFKIAVKPHKSLIARFVYASPLSVKIDDEIYNNPLNYDFGAFDSSKDVEQKKHDINEISEALIGRFEHQGF